MERSHKLLIIGIVGFSVMLALVVLAIVYGLYKTGRDLSNKDFNRKGDLVSEDTTVRETRSASPKITCADIGQVALVGEIRLDQQRGAASKGLAQMQIRSSTTPEQKLDCAATVEIQGANVKSQLKLNSNGFYEAGGDSGVPLTLTPGEIYKITADILKDGNPDIVASVQLSKIDPAEIKAKFKPQGNGTLTGPTPTQVSIGWREQADAAHTIFYGQLSGSSDFKGGNKFTSGCVTGAQIAPVEPCEADVTSMIFGQDIPYPFDQDVKTIYFRYQTETQGEFSKGSGRLSAWTGYNQWIRCWNHRQADPSCP